MKRLMFIGAVSAAMLTPTVAIAAKEPKMTPMQIQELQTREVEAAKNVAFSSVMTVLQDSGYRINAADRETGLITAAASTKTNMTWMPFVGFGKSKKTPVVSAYIEDITPTRTRVRLTFVMTKMSANQFGGGEDEEPILDATVYREAFEKINQQVFIRLAAASPAPTPVAAIEAPVATTTAPQASGTKAAN